MQIEVIFEGQYHTSLKDVKYQTDSQISLAVDMVISGFLIGGVPTRYPTGPLI